MKMTKSKFILYSFRILSLFSVVDCVQFVSQFGQGFCLLYPDIITFRTMGPKMCMFACQKNKDCMSINHHKDTLDCQLFSWNSMNISQFEIKNNCTHYSSQGDPLNTDKCDGEKCEEHHTCVDMLDGTDYCVRTECSAPQFVNVMESAGMDFVGGLRSLTCDYGYELIYGVTSLIMTCKSNGEWNGTANCSVEICPEPLAPSNGIIFPGENIVGSTRNVQCNIGYLNVGAPPTIECFNNRTWTNWTGSCKACDDPNTIPYAVISDGNVTVGSNRTYACNIGFEDNGESPLITCNESAMWTTTEFSCRVVECAEPLPPSNGTILPGNNTVGSTRVVECDTGFALIGGSPTIECLVSQQTWSVWTGSCEVCGEPESIQYAVISEGDRTVGSIRMYICITGYEGNGESPNITCDDNGLWTSSLFSCSLIDCGSPPNIASMTFVSNGSTWLSTAEYFCSYGFVVSGNGTIVCSSSGEWSSTEIYCTEPSTVIFDFEDDDQYNFVSPGYGYWSFKLMTGQTKSSYTGPTGAYHGTKYRYFEGTGPEADDVARMESDFYFSAEVHCIDFFYSMYGEDIGTMRIKYLGYGSYLETLLWSDTGDKQEPTWFNANVTVNVTKKFKLIVEATRGGSGYKSDAAIDYIRLFDAAC